MPIGTPFHEQTAKVCSSLRYKDWAGYHAVNFYDSCHEPEYFAIRHATAIIDVSPLFKYDFTGPDAGSFLARMLSKDVRTLKEHQVTYLCWCDEDGFVIDDGTVTRLGKNHYRLTAADPSFSWFSRYQRGYDVTITDISLDWGILSVQGPTSRDYLNSLLRDDLGELRFFRTMENELAGRSVWVSRTGYTGDLGYEVWISKNDAGVVYERMLAERFPFRAQPCGLDAMDMARVEAGFVMNGVDYYSSIHCMTDARKSTPYELGLGWTVKLDRERFVGQSALRREQTQGSRRHLVGLEMVWTELEEQFAEYGLPPEVPGHAWREAVPIYNNAGQFVGQATSGTWSPILKKNICLASVMPGVSKLGTELKWEVTVEFQRQVVSAHVVKLPFFDPQRKRKP